MTTTPDSWNDVGCLRLQVECLSKELERIHVREREERQCTKICQVVGAVTVVLLVCVATLHSMMLYNMYHGSAPSLSRKPADDKWPADLRNFEDSKTNSVPSVTQRSSKAQELKQTSMEPAALSVNTTAAAMDTQGVAQKYQEDLQGSRKDTKVARGKDSSGRDHNELMEEIMDDKQLAVPIDTYGRLPQGEEMLADMLSAQARPTMLSKEEKQGKKAEQGQTKPADVSGDETKRGDQKKEDEPLKVADFRPQLPDDELSASDWLEFWTEKLPESSPLFCLERAQALDVAMEDLRFTLKHIMARKGIPQNAAYFDIMCAEAINTIIKERQSRWREM